MGLKIKAEFENGAWCALLVSLAESDPLWTYFLICEMGVIVPISYSWELYFKWCMWKLLADLRCLINVSCYSSFNLTYFTYLQGCPQSLKMTNSYWARKSMLSGMGLLNFPLFSHFHIRILCLQSSSLLFFSKTSPLSMPIFFQPWLRIRITWGAFQNAGVCVHHRPINMELGAWHQYFFFLSSLVGWQDNSIRVGGVGGGRTVFKNNYCWKWMAILLQKNEIESMHKSELKMDYRLKCKR